MNKLVIITLALSLLLGVGLSLADTQEPCDACGGATLYLVLMNDQDYHPGLSPSSATYDLSCCPDWMTPADHYTFPDTLPLPHTIDSLVAISEGDGSDPDSIVATDWWHSDVITGSSIQIPPASPTCCCTNGVYWKARMFDNTSSTWSAWKDINFQRIFAVFGTTLIAVLQLDNFKLPDYSANMEFDCDFDSLVVYVWDCENEPGGDETQGEFGILNTVFTNSDIVASTITDTVWLQRYKGDIGIGDNQPKLPADYFISQNSPNPFNATTAIQYGIPEDAEVHVEITNILGQKVATLVDEHQTAGYKRLIWNGRDDMGRELSSGVYFYSIKANGFMDKKRAILMK